MELVIRWLFQFTVKFIHGVLTFLDNLVMMISMFDGVPRLSLILKTLKLLILQLELDTVLQLMNATRSTVGELLPIFKLEFTSSPKFNLGKKQNSS